LVLTFLATQFRLAAAAAEANARNAGQIQAHFSKLGVNMWRSRAEQLADTLRVFPASKLKRAIELTFEADRALRDTRPDDRTVMESFVWKLTGA
jgi:DNA polymerase-3 subunit delta